MARLSRTSRAGTAPATERAEFERLYLTGRTAKYVINQPVLAKTVWEKSLEKHVHEYGAPLTEESKRVLASVFMFKERR